MPPRPPHERHVPSSAISRFIDAPQIEALLAPYVPDPEDRAFVARCVVGEGPAHHRGANYVLLRLMGQLLERLPRVAAAQAGSAVDVPLRIPPHLKDERGPAAYPLTLPLAPLEGLAAPGSPELDAMIDCLTDGPPHHALANVAMVTLLAELAVRVQAAAPGTAK
ncbi:MAG: hypothetical protein M3Y59_08765 [Myxococcota bacterium]|nr:hypothetical protein [Myxococcota bacterium]